MLKLIRLRIYMVDIAVSENKFLINAFILILFTCLGVILTQPLIYNFSTALTGVDDVLHFDWVLWHIKQALLFREPLFFSNLLYYPHGATLLTTAVGPLMGLFALPFWPWGPAAAYNGALLVGFVLTGYCMFLLARSIGFDMTVSFFAGVIFLVSPMHLVATYGHLSKIFLGGIPLTLLSLHLALDPKKNQWWAFSTGIGLLVTLLTSGEQFVFASLAVVFFMTVRIITVSQANRPAIIKRCLLIFCFCFFTTGWLALKTFLVTRDPTLLINTSESAYLHQPDLVQFFIPSAFYNRFWGPIFNGFMWKYNVSLLETEVYLFWTGLLLSIVGLIKSRNSIGPWFVLLIGCMILALGPDLKVFGLHHVTGANFSIRMPYFYLTHLPGLGFLRTPGRFMLLGSVGFGISASFGLAWLKQRLTPGLGFLLSLLSIGLVLFESWPTPWPQTKLWPVPEFYQQIAGEDQQYGIFDLPIRPEQEIGYYSSYVIYSSHYQIYQMTHGKGIASGYIDRWYLRHPLFSWFVSNTSNTSPSQKDFKVNGNATNFYANVRYELARNDYRYVVYHKPIEGVTPYQKGSWGEKTSLEFIENVFGDQSPLVDDNLVTVYEVGTLSSIADQISMTISPMLTDDDSWRTFVSNQNWFSSPAPFYVASPQTTPAILELVIKEVTNTCLGSNIERGDIIIESNDQPLTKMNFSVGQPVHLPLKVSKGSGIVNIRLSDPDSETDPSCFIFSIQYANFQADKQGSDQKRSSFIDSDP